MPTNPMEPQWKHIQGQGYVKVFPDGTVRSPGEALESSAGPDPALDPSVSLRAGMPEVGRTLEAVIRAQSGSMLPRQELPEEAIAAATDVGMGAPASSPSLDPVDAIRQQVAQQQGADAAYAEAPDAPRLTPEGLDMSVGEVADQLREDIPLQQATGADSYLNEMGQDWLDNRIRQLKDDRAMHAMKMDRRYGSVTEDPEQMAADYASDGLPRNFRAAMRGASSLAPRGHAMELRNGYNRFANQLPEEAERVAPTSDEIDAVRASISGETPEQLAAQSGLSAEALIGQAKRRAMGLGDQGNRGNIGQQYAKDRQRTLDQRAANVASRQFGRRGRENAARAAAMQQQQMMAMMQRNPKIANAMLAAQAQNFRTNALSQSELARERGLTTRSQAEADARIRAAQLEAQMRRDISQGEIEGRNTVAGINAGTQNQLSAQDKIMAWMAGKDASPSERKAMMDWVAGGESGSPPPGGSGVSTSRVPEAYRDATPEATRAGLRNEGWTDEQILPVLIAKAKNRNRLPYRKPTISNPSGSRNLMEWLFGGMGGVMRDPTSSGWTLEELYPDDAPSNPSPAPAAATPTPAAAAPADDDFYWDNVPGRGPVKFRRVNGKYVEAK